MKKIKISTHLLKIIVRYVDSKRIIHDICCMNKKCFALFYNDLLKHTTCNDFEYLFTRNHYNHCLRVITTEKSIERIRNVLRTIRTLLIFPKNKHTTAKLCIYYSHAYIRYKDLTISLEEKYPFFLTANNEGTNNNDGGDDCFQLFQT